MSKNNLHPTDTECFVAATDIKEYKILDKRCIKPFIIKDNDIFLVLERLDIIHLHQSQESIAYIPPNPIALQLAFVEQCVEKIEKMNIKKELMYQQDDPIYSLIANQRNTLLMYEYISLTQQAIVFGYTALETFANLSIPDDYIHLEDGRGAQEGITKSFSKQAIERQLPLKQKLKDILPKIYSTKPIHQENFWGLFCQFEACRNEIIHQKSSDRAKIYREYFKIQSYFNVPNQIISFFKKEAHLNNKDNLLWPWLPDESPDDIPYIDDAMSMLKGAQVTQYKF